MISCYHFKNNISSYIDKKISFQKRQEFEEHLTKCSSCKALFESIIQTRQQLHNLPAVTVSEDFLPNLRQRILADRNARIMAGQERFSWRRLPAFVYGFAAALVAVIIGFMLYKSPPKTGNYGAPPQIVQDKIKTRNAPADKAGNTGRSSEKAGQLVSTESSGDSIHNATSKPKQQDDFQEKIVPVKKEY